MKIDEKLVRKLGFELRRIRKLVKKKQKYRLTEAFESGVFPWIIKLDNDYHMFMYGDGLQAYVKLIEDLYEEIQIITKEELISRINNLIPKIMEQENDTLVQQEVDKFFKELESLNLVKWTLYAPLNIKLDETIEIGQIKIHMPNTAFWEFLKEPSFMGNGSIYEKVKNLPYLELKINASTNNYAIMVGKKTIEDYLNFIRLILFTIEKVEIIPYYYVTNNQTEYLWEINTPWVPQLELLGDERVSFNEILDKTKFMIPIIEKATANKNKLSDIEERVYKGLKWFGRGQNEDDDIIKFINYVTVAEILTIVGRKKTTSKFKQMIGFIFQKAGRKKMEELADELYDKRSRILHAGVSEISKREISDIESISRSLLFFFSEHRDEFKTLDQFYVFSIICDMISL